MKESLDSPVVPRARRAENDGQNALPDEKSHESRKAEKAMAKTDRNAKRPRIPTFGAENGPRRKKRQIPENGGQNAVCHGLRQCFRRVPRTPPVLEYRDKGHWPSQWHTPLAAQ